MVPSEVVFLKIRVFLREYRYTLLLMLATAIGITVTGVVFKQAPIRMMPLYVSLIISLMHTRAIRYAHLMGSMNVILYGFVNLHYGLLASAMSCFFFSCPVQFITFLRWHKHKDGSSTEFRKLGWRGRALLALTCLAVWGGTLFILRLVGSAHSLLDSFVTIFDIMVAALTMLAFIEHAPLRIPGSILNIALMLIVVFDGTPEQIPYVIYNTYALICVTIGSFSTLRIYNKQRAAAAVGATKGELV